MYICYSAAYEHGENSFCCAPGCSNSRKTRDDLQFYRIQKDISRRRVWLKRIRRKKNFSPADNTRLCSVHFFGGQNSDKIDSVSYNCNPAIFKQNHVKRQLSRSTKNSLAAARLSNAPELVRRKRQKPVRRN